MNKLIIFGILTLAISIYLSVFSSNDGSDFLSGLLLGTGIGLTLLGIRKKYLKKHGS